MNNLETLLTTTVDKVSSNAIGSIVGRFVKPRAPTIFGHSAYFLDGPGPHEEFSTFLLVYEYVARMFQVDAVEQLECTEYGGP